MITKDEQIMNTPYNLDRFLSAQEQVYATVLKELRNGKKETHWMWYIFPQLKQLGFSSTSQFYGLADLNEARAYLQHPILRQRLEECIEVLMAGQISNPTRIFGHPDDLKFHSCLTLFLLADSENEIFKKALDKFYGGIGDFDTERIVSK